MRAWVHDYRDTPFVEEVIEAWAIRHFEKDRSHTQFTGLFTPFFTPFFTLHEPTWKRVSQPADRLAQHFGDTILGSSWRFVEGCGLAA